MRDAPKRPGPRAPRIVAGAVLLVLGLAAAVVSTAFQTSPTAKVLGPNLPVNAGARRASDISANNSPTLARNPVDGANLAVVNRIDTPRFSCALHVSLDGGDRWSQVPVPRPEGEEPKCYAPDAAFGADGTLYMSFVTLKGRANAPNAVWIVSSRDGGRSLSKPVRALGPLAFQVRLTADPAAPRRLYLTWLDASEVGLYKFTQPGNPIRAARSENAGRSWRRPARVSDPSRPRAIAPSPAVGPRGELYVLYLDLGEDRLDYEGAHRGQGGPPHPGPWRLVLARSRDRGATWEETVPEERLVPTERFIAFTPPFPSLAVDARSGRIYAGFHDGSLGDPDVRVWSLAAGGSSWEGPKRVNDTAERDGTSQHLPKLAVAPDGRLDVAYYDRRADPEDAASEVSLQSSFDGGATFMERVPLSDRPFDSSIGYGSDRGMPDPGSRLGLLSDRARSVVVWSDTRQGSRISNKQDLARAIVAFEGPRLSPPVKYGLLVGGLALALLGLGVLVSSVLGSGTGGGGSVTGSRAS